MQALPGILVDLGLEGGFQGLVGIVGAQEVGLTDKEAFLVIVRIHKPAGDVIGLAGADLAGAGFEHVHAIDLDAQHAGLAAFGVGLGQQADVRFTEDDEEIALAVVLEVLAHVQVRVHAGLEHRDLAQLAELRRMGIVVERAGDDHIEARIRSLANGLHQILT